MQPASVTFVLFADVCMIILIDNLKCSNAFPTVSIPYVNPMQSSVVFQGFILEIENYPIDKGMIY